jgi:hypothetical protein
MIQDAALVRQRISTQTTLGVIYGKECFQAIDTAEQGQDSRSLALWAELTRLIGRGINRSTHGEVAKLGGAAQVPFRVVLTPDAPREFGIKPRNHSRAVQDLIDNLADQGLQRNFIEQAPKDPTLRRHPVDHCAPISGDKRRPCADTTALNPWTVPVRMRVLTTQLVQSKIPSGTRLYMSTDAKDAFYTVEIEESS